MQSAVPAVPIKLINRVLLMAGRRRCGVEREGMAAGVQLGGDGGPCEVSQGSSRVPGAPLPIGGFLGVLRSPYVCCVPIAVRCTLCVRPAGMLVGGRCRAPG